MPDDNLTRMIRLADEFFEVKNDPEQLAIDQEVMERLRRLHPRTINEIRDENGPITWILLIPTTNDLMKQFLSDELSERRLFEKTPAAEKYDAIYLCSALVLPEHRHKGLAKKLTVEAIQAIRQDHPITSLFYWWFSPGGENLALSVAKECKLPLYKRDHLVQ